ncbi:hypothetical protein [Nonomuraea sp. NEAU-A123]|uniref:TolB family protein n=1 Tax=Nonomuraea sp. NEAU-A123 TaxID=2839649 RepID=UPI001BE40348|nr:hypothetical protein [Nonomuraea sp. NEAU-A123]MBT2233779.1 hypothetical protein [Nonomuraea sp. NEAU-A123]
MFAGVYAFPRFAGEDANEAQFTERTTGRRFSVPTVAPSLHVKSPQWSGDGRRLLLTAYSDKEAVGPVVVDVAARRGTLTRIDTPGTGTQPYLWLPDGSGVVRIAGKTQLRAYSLNGTVLRTYPDAAAAVNTDEWFSPSGRRLAAICPGKPAAACLLDTATGERQTRVPLPTGTTLWGWFNEDHLLVYGDGTVDVLDGAGRPVRRLAELETGDKGSWEVHFTRAW